MPSPQLPPYLPFARPAFNATWLPLIPQAAGSRCPVGITINGASAVSATVSTSSVSSMTIQKKSGREAYEGDEKTPDAGMCLLVLFRLVRA